MTLEALQAPHIEANPGLFLFESGDPLDRDKLPEQMASFLTDAEFKPLYEEASLINVPDYVVKWEADGVDKDFRRSYANLMEKKEGPKAGATLGIGKFGEQEAVIYASQWVRGGAVGEVEGELLVQAFLKAKERNLPVVLDFASGGMDQAQGPMALTQMARGSSMMEWFKQVSDQPVVCIVRDPTTGGTIASTALMGDLNVAVGPQATSGFTGPRIQNFKALIIDRDRSTTLRPVDQSAVTNMLNGNGIDVIAEPGEEYKLVSDYLKVAMDDIEPSLSEAAEGIKELAIATGNIAVRRAVDAFRRSDAAIRGKKRMLPVHGDVRLLSVMEPVFKTRNSLTQHFHSREFQLAEPIKNNNDKVLTLEQKWRENYETHLSPRALDHLDTMVILDHAFDSYQLLRNPHEHSNRVHFDNVVIAQAKIEGKAVMVIGQQPDYKAVNIGTEAEPDYKLERVFASLRPKDWRRVARAVKRAERRGMPIINFLDSPGAASDRAAEAGGQALAMSESEAAINGATVPVLSYVTGAGGSGGVECAMSIFPQPSAFDTTSIFVATPLATAAIYKNDHTEGEDPNLPPIPSLGLINETAEAAKLGPEAWLGEDKFFRRIIKTDDDPRATASKYLRPILIEDLHEFGNMTPEQIMEGRLNAIVLTGANVKLEPVGQVEN